MKMRIKMPFVARFGLGRVSIYRLLLFVAPHSFCFLLSKTKTGICLWVLVSASCCSFWFFVDVSIQTSHCSFWVFVGTKNQNDQQEAKMSK